MGAALAIEQVVAGAAGDQVTGVAASDVVVAGAGVDDVGGRCAADQRVVASGTGERDRGQSGGGRQGHAVRGGDCERALHLREAAEGHRRLVAIVADDVPDAAAAGAQRAGIDGGVEGEIDGDVAADCYEGGRVEERSRTYVPLMVRSPSTSARSGMSTVSRLWLFVTETSPPALTSALRFRVTTPLLEMTIAPA